LDRLAEEVAKKMPPVKQLGASLDSAVGPAGTVAGTVMALLANDRDGLEFFHYQYPGGRKIPPAPEGSVTGSSALGMAKSLRDSGNGSTEGKVERDLLMGMGDLSRRVIGKPGRGSGADGGGTSQGTWILARLGYGSGCDQWWGLCYS
jgi:hypothetical protein